MELTFEIDAPEFYQALNPLIPKAIELGMRQALAVVDARAKANLSGRILKIKSGRLRQSLQMRVENTGNEVIGTYGTNVFYGALHEKGVKGPWEIKPKSRDGVLRFVVGGKVVYAKKVRHPGLKRRPWLGTAWRESSKEVGVIFEQAIRRAVQQAGVTIAKGKLADMGKK